MKNCLTFIPALCILAIIFSNEVSAIQDMCTMNGQQDAGTAVATGDYKLKYASSYTDYLGTPDVIGCTGLKMSTDSSGTLTFTINAVVTDADGNPVTYNFPFLLNSDGTGEIEHRIGAKDGISRNIYIVLQYVDSCTIALTLCSQPDPPTTDDDVRLYHWLLLLDSDDCGDSNVSDALQALTDRGIPTDDIQSVSCTE